MPRNRRHRPSRSDPLEGQEDRLPASFLDPAALPEKEIAFLLERAEIVGYQVMPAGTNYTFATLMSDVNRGQFLAIYKPEKGENPLWDFPQGLHHRERAAYLTSRQLGWPRIPTTIIRDGPFGEGMVQLFVPTKSRWDFDRLREERRRELTEIALFDLLTNNADRKAGHCLLGTDGEIWAIDHGLTFNVAPKLRTVLWDCCGEPISEGLLEQLEEIHGDGARRQGLRSVLESDLTPEEIEAFFRRLERTLRTRRYPQLDPDRNIPWPLV